MHRLSLIVLAALAAGTAAAQETTQPPDPTDPRARAPVVEYRSAFANYRPLGDDKVAPWRESNDAVKGDGDEAHTAPQPAARPKAEPQPPLGEQHGGHR